ERSNIELTVDSESVRWGRGNTSLRGGGLGLALVGRYPLTPALVLRGDGRLSFGTASLSVDGARIAPPSTPTYLSTDLAFGAEWLLTRRWSVHTSLSRTGFMFSSANVIGRFTSGFGLNTGIAYRWRPIGGLELHAHLSVQASRLSDRSNTVRLNGGVGAGWVF
ncbi:MAG: hypothetical protein AAFY60_21475, partial [Myxococcota bacterium]